VAQSVGDLFVSLGVKGSEKTIGALTDVKKGFGDIVSSSLIAKASIVAAIAAIGHTVNELGTSASSLNVFSSVTGMSPEKIQQMQKAIYKSTGQEVNLVPTLQGMQDAIVNMRKGEGLSLKSLATIAKTISPKGAENKLLAWEKDTTLMMQDFQAYATIMKNNRALASNMLRGGGIKDDAVIAAMFDRALTASNIAKQPYIPASELKASQERATAFGEVWDAIYHRGASKTFKKVEEVSPDSMMESVAVGIAKRLGYKEGNPKGTTIHNHANVTINMKPGEPASNVEHHTKKGIKDAHGQISTRGRTN
jgi:hypothetical protein